MFSATVITGMSMKCWCTIPIPASIASRAEENEMGFPFSRDLSPVGPVEPVEDVHERRLARAVLAEQGVHLAAAHVERDAVVGDDSRELLADVPHLEDEIVGHGCFLQENEEGGLEGPPSRNRFVLCYLRTAGGLSLPLMIFVL